MEKFFLEDVLAMYTSDDCNNYMKNERTEYCDRRLQGCSPVGGLDVQHYALSDKIRIMIADVDLYVQSLEGLGTCNFVNKVP